MIPVTRGASKPKSKSKGLSRNLICQFIVNISILFNLSVYCPVFQFAETTEQQHVPSPLQRSRAGAVFSEDVGRLSEQTRLTASAEKDRRVSARAEKTVPARVAEGQAAGRPFFCILFFGRAKKSMKEKMGRLAQIAVKNQASRKFHTAKTPRRNWTVFTKPSALIIAARYCMIVRS
ncbi:MAG: hypothetical protein SWH68_09815 [Thermodesulfobacteriota bacterium]|nr:hypothetical protein [Thermodesulfobacteriota bacterium]